MPYRFLDGITAADVAFEAWGDTPEAMMLAAAEATMAVMVPDLLTIRPHLKRTLQLQADDLELLLHSLLSELVYLKDAERLLLRVTRVDLSRKHKRLALAAMAEGERLDPVQHEFGADVKAVTFHRFAVSQQADTWHATVVLDV